MNIADLKTHLTNGVTPAMATPIAEDGYTVNTTVLPQLVDFLIDAGVVGLFVGGTTGEGIVLSVDERRRLHEETMTAVNGRCPVLLHVGANQTQTAVALAKHAVSLQADGIVAITPTFYGVDEDGLFDYFATIATAAPDTPLLAYDIPHMAVNGISPALLARLGAELPTMAGVKTSRHDMQVIRRLIDAAPDHLMVLAGNEAIALGSLALGAHGLISGLSTAVPEPFVALTHAFGVGDITGAQALQRQINALLALMPAGRRIGGIKQILAERGIPVGTAVAPRNMPTEPIWSKMEALLA